MNKQKNEKLLKNEPFKRQINPIRTNTHVQNRVKINFAYKNQPYDKQKYDDLINSNQEINAWETALNKQDNQIGMIRFKLKQKVNKKTEKNIYFISRASLTTKSWNAQRERLHNLRKQLPMANPKFQHQDSAFVKYQNILGYFKRKKEQQFQNNNNEHSQNSINFKKHRNLLSRIYSHSVEPKILIRGFSPPQQYNSNIPPTTPQKYINSFRNRHKQISTNNRQKYKMLDNFERAGIKKKKQKQVFNNLSNQKRLQIKFRNNSQVKNQLKII